MYSDYIYGTFGCDVGETNELENAQIVRRLGSTD